MKQNKSFPIRLLLLTGMLIGLIVIARKGEQEAGNRGNVFSDAVSANGFSALSISGSGEAEGTCESADGLTETMQKMMEENRDWSLQKQNMESSPQTQEASSVIRVLITAPDGSYGWTRKEIMDCDLLNKYPGEMLIADSKIMTQYGEELYYVINHVELEVYLQYVVQAEMPADFPMEALKAQAVCARTYAVKQMEQERLYAYHADVDDTVMFQEYQISTLSSRVTEAVEATKGEILTYDGEPIRAYYYSCSGGYSTTDAIWDYEESDRCPYLTSRCYGELEKECPWYRWNLLSGENIHERILARVQERSRANANAVTCNFEDYDSFGPITEMEITKRLDGGVVHCLRIASGENVIEIRGEYNIRYVLGGSANTILLQDGTQKELDLVPSGFFELQIIKSNNDEVVQYLLTGGGFGHGVGMSQYGAKYLAQQGDNYCDILTYFFDNVNIMTIDDLQRIK